MTPMLPNLDVKRTASRVGTSLAIHRVEASQPEHPTRSGGTRRTVEAAEEACRQGEDLLKTIIDSSKAVVYLKDPEGRYRLINRQWAELIGVTQESVVGKTDYDVFPTEIADGFRVNDLKILDAGKAVEVEELAPHPDGLHTYLSIKVPLLGADGVPYALCGISTDITERKQMEEALRLSEEQFRGAFDAAAVGMALTDPEGYWLRVNPALCEIVGQTEAELLKSTIDALIHPDDVENAVNLMGRALAGEIASFQTEQRFVHQNGKVLWLRLSMSVVRNLAGRTLHFVTQMEDITRRKQAEELAGRLFAELQEAYDATIAGWARALDLRDHETEGHSRRVTEVTLRLARAMGVSEADLIQIRRGALLHDIGKMGVPDAILLKPGELTAEEWPIMRRHPTLAAAMLEPIAFLRPALDIPYCHHERWDGTGYPRGLIGEEIPLAARIFAVVDIWDALRHDRPYRTAWPEEAVRAHLRSLAGTHLDPTVVTAFLDRFVSDRCLLRDPSTDFGAPERPVAPPRPASTTDPIRDPARLASLRATGLMTEAESVPLDRLVKLLSHLLKAPVALVSLLDDHRQFFKSRCGLPEPWNTLRETPVAQSYCQEVVGTGAPLILPDVRTHPNFDPTSVVTRMGVAAYAGMPLITSEGHVLGAFCAVDVKPRVWSEEDQAILRDLAAAVMTEIELRTDIAARQRVEEELRQSQRRVAEQLSIALDLNRELKGRQRAPARDPGRSVDLASTDLVTGLVNYRHFAEMLPIMHQRSVSRGKPLSVILIDVDELRLIQDRFGRPVGDDILQGVAAAVTGQIRIQDLAAQFGGQEFIILLPETDAPDAEGLAERLRLAVRTHPWPQCPVTASFGVATSAPSDDGPWTTIDHADLALTISKRQGRNRVTHHRDLPPADSRATPPHHHGTRMRSWPETG